MTQEDKELLLKDLCSRLPYKPKIQWDCADYDLLALENCEPLLARIIDNRPYSYAISKPLEEIKPYLRPMSSMTDEELVEFLGIRGMNLNSEELKTFREGQTAIVSTLPSYSRHMDWLNAHHFDYRGLIENGLAIAVTEKNNPYK